MISTIILAPYTKILLNANQFNQCDKTGTQTELSFGFAKIFTKLSITFVRL